MTLLGAVLGQWETAIIERAIVGSGLLLGFLGVGGLVLGCLNLFQATRLSMANIREEAELIRTRQEKQRRASDGSAT